MEAVLLVIHVLIAMALIGMVLIQRSDSDGFGMGSGGGSGFMSSRGTANFLTRTTAILATLFIITSLALGIIASNRSSHSIVDTIVSEKEDKGENKQDKKLSSDADTKSNKEQPNSTSKTKQSKDEAPAVPTAE